MNIEEKAQEYAQNKMQQVLNDAVAEAYKEGYKQGYEDGKAEIPVCKDDDTENEDFIFDLKSRSEKFRKTHGGCLIMTNGVTEKLFIE